MGISKEASNSMWSQEGIHRGSEVWTEFKRISRDVLSKDWPSVNSKQEKNYC